MLIPLTMILLLIFILGIVIVPVLKLMGIIEWSWTLIFAPIWIPLTLLLLWLLGWGLFWGFFLGLLAFIQK